MNETTFFQYVSLWNPVIRIFFWAKSRRNRQTSRLTQKELSSVCCVRLGWHDARIAWRLFIPTTPELSFIGKLFRNREQNTRNFFGKNKAGYTAQDAPCMRTFHLRKQQRDQRTDGPTDATSYKDATAHLKTKMERSAQRQCGASGSAGTLALPSVWLLFWSVTIGFDKHCVK